MWHLSERDELALVAMRKHKLKFFTYVFHLSFPLKWGNFKWCLNGA